MKLVTLPLVAALLLPASAIADPKEQRSDRTDPNKVVCRTEGVTGSRLGARKRCLTAREWTEMTLADRQSLERTQANRYNGNESAGGALQGGFGRFN